jgi:hypothetical protein
LEWQGPHEELFPASVHTGVPLVHPFVASGAPGSQPKQPCPETHCWSLGQSSGDIEHPVHLLSLPQIGVVPEHP